MSETIENQSEEQKSLSLDEQKAELAELYLSLLDSKKDTIVGSVATLGIAINPLKEKAKAYLLAQDQKKKKGFFENITDKLKDTLIKKASKEAKLDLEYNRADLDKMKSLIKLAGDNEEKIKIMRTQIQNGEMPSLDEQDKTEVAVATAAIGTTAPIVAVASDKLSDSKETSHDYTFPLVGDTITSPKGPRWGKKHEGIDIAGVNTEIKSIGDGVVESVGFGSKKEGFNGYGNYAVVKLNDGNRVLYGHMEKLSSLKVNDPIKSGNLIGIMGDTGHSKGTHLHLEIRKGEKNDSVSYFDRKALDPLAVLPVHKNQINDTILARVDKKVMDEIEKNEKSVA